MVRVEMGVSVYLLKSASFGQLLAAIRSAVSLRKERSLSWLCPGARSGREGSGDVPTTRPLEILALAVQGLSNRQIAAALHLAEITVKRHLANIYRKTGVGSRKRQ